ncbi:hypothetical protein PINS_up023288 [Pythium insidiosum]|nr:hypothetical protein PINS_up023288 [Pythium insidiosum]
MWVLKHFMATVRDVDAIVPPCRLAQSAIEIVETCGAVSRSSWSFASFAWRHSRSFQKAHQQVNASQSRQNSMRTRSGVGFNATGSFNSSTAASSGGRFKHTIPERPSFLLKDMASTFTDMMKQVLRQMEPLVQTGATILSEMSRIFSDPRAGGFDA